MGAHLIDDKFQSDKYPWCERDFMPLKFTDKMAWPFLWGYAEERRKVDPEFADDAQTRLKMLGFDPSTQDWGDGPLPEDKEIAAAHPARTGKHDVWAEAMRLVGARRSKGSLVALVNWLLAALDAKKSP